MLRAQMKKVETIEQLGNSKKEQKEMPKIKNTITVTKNAFDKFINSWRKDIRS